MEIARPGDQVVPCFCALSAKVRTNKVLYKIHPGVRERPDLKHRGKSISTYIVAKVLLKVAEIEPAHVRLIQQIVLKEVHAPNKPLHNNPLKPAHNLPVNQPALQQPIALPPNNNPPIADETVHKHGQLALNLPKLVLEINILDPALVHQGGAPPGRA